MPRPQLITRKVDALGAQQRIILWLECKHTVSVTMRELVGDKDMQARIKAATTWVCPFCPDAPPPDRSPQARWRDAGEP